MLKRIWSIICKFWLRKKDDIIGDVLVSVIIGGIIGGFITVSITQKLQSIQSQTEQILASRTTIEAMDEMNWHTACWI